MINGKYGYINDTGSVEINAIFDNATYFNEDNFAIVTYGGKKGIIDLKGKFVVVPKYDDIGTMSDGIIPVKTGRMWGFINYKGDKVIESNYINALAFKEGLAPVMYETYGYFDNLGKFRSVRNKYGYINSKGETVINPAYSSASIFSNNIACVKEYNYWKVIYSSGTTINDGKYTECKKIEHGRVYLKNKNMNILLDNSGRTLLEIEADEIDLMREGYCVVYETDFYSYINKREVQEASWEKATLYRLGSTIDRRIYRRDIGEVDVFEPEKILDKSFFKKTPNGRNAYYLDISGKKINNKKYYDARAFSEGLAAVKFENNLKWGFIDSFGELVINPKYDNAGDFRGGLAPVVIRGREAYIDKKGGIVWESK